MTGFVQADYGATAPDNIAPVPRLIEQMIATKREFTTKMTKAINN